MAALFSLRSNWTVWHTGLSVGNDKDLLAALVADLKGLSVAFLVDHRDSDVIIAIPRNTAKLFR